MVCERSAISMPSAVPKSSPVGQFIGQAFGLSRVSKKASSLGSKSSRTVHWSGGGSGKHSLYCVRKAHFNFRRMNARFLVSAVRSRFRNTLKHRFRHCSWWATLWKVSRRAMRSSSSSAAFNFRSILVKWKLKESRSKHRMY